MKQWFLIGCLGVVALGCAGKVVDRSDRSDAEVLADEQDDLCDDICTKVETCGDLGSDSCDCYDDVCECYEPPTRSRCVAECERLANDAVARGEPCAETTLAGLRCYDGLSCDAIAARDTRTCENLMEAAFDCSQDEDSDEPPVATSPGEPEPGETTGACWASGSAGEPEGGHPVGTVLCEEGCSGTPEREVTCVQGFDAVTCTCSLDGAAVAEFEIAECGGGLLDPCPWSLE